jgi:transcriptional regulator with XRE-family HTH domain
MRYGIGTTSSVEVDVQKLKALREERVMTLRELGEKAGVSKDTIWRLEHGRSEAYTSTIRKLAQALEEAALEAPCGRGHSRRTA